MRRTMFEAGFNSPTHSYGIVPPAQSQLGQVRLGQQLGNPQVGSLWTDVKDLFKGNVAPKAAAPPPPPVPAPSGTVLGIPTSYVLIGGGVMLILGLVAAVVGSKKKGSGGGPAPVPPKSQPSVGRRRR